jgi:hypothetical protein
MKFVRRTDLDASTRLLIIAQALLAKGIYGKMSALATEYRISRTLLYRLLGQAYCCWLFLASTENNKASEPRPVEPIILLLRLEGRCSLSSISEILRFMDLSPHSTGSISELLTRYGAQLPSTLQTSSPRQVIYLSDEIFAISSPILITIEPKSTAILKIELAKDRTAETWQQHFDSLKQQNYIANGLSSDRGNGIIAGFQGIYPEADWFSDHFHEFRGLAQSCTQLENKAYTAIQHEAECLRKFNNAHSENNLQRRLAEYEVAAQQCTAHINRYEAANELYQWVRRALFFFDANGQPQQQDKVVQELLLLFSLLLELGYPGITQQVITLTRHLDEITHYFKSVNAVWQSLSEIVPTEALPFICAAWQHHHFSHQTKSSTKQAHQIERDFLLGCAKPWLHEPKEVIQTAFEQLNSIVRASSLVEMVNSKVRPYLDSCKGQITQESLNLIMFYHNYHRYKSGKRQLSAPIELLTGTQLQKHWVELLLDQQRSPVITASPQQRHNNLGSADHQSTQGCYLDCEAA